MIPQLEEKVKENLDRAGRFPSDCLFPPSRSWLEKFLHEAASMDQRTFGTDIPEIPGAISLDPQDSWEMAEVPGKVPPGTSFVIPDEEIFAKIREEAPEARPEEAAQDLSPASGPDIQDDGLSPSPPPQARLHDARRRGAREAPPAPVVPTVPKRPMATFWRRLDLFNPFRPWRDLARVTADPDALADVFHQTDALCLAAARVDGMSVRHARKRFPALDEAAVTQTPFAIGFVLDQTLPLNLRAVKANGMALAGVRDQSGEVWREAIRRTPKAVRCLREPCDEAVMLAVSLDPDTILEVEDPAEPAVVAAVTARPRLILSLAPEARTHAAWLAAARGDGMVLRGVLDEEMADDVMDAAVTENGNALKFIGRQTEELQLKAMRQDGMALQYALDPSDKVIMESLARDGRAVKFVPEDRLTVAMCLLAVRTSGSEAFERLPERLKGMFARYGRDEGEQPEMCDEGKDGAGMAQEFTLA
jgi:hypothetical protein